MVWRDVSHVEVYVRKVLEKLKSLLKVIQDSCIMQARYIFMW